MIIFFIIILYIAFLWIASHRRTPPKKVVDINDKEYINYKDTYQKFLAHLDKLDGGKYILNSDRERFKKEYHPSYMFLMEAHSGDKTNSTMLTLLEKYSEYDSLVDRNNEIYLEQKIEENSKLFDNIDGKSLDKRQRYAVVQEERNHLVVAGAGTGKTLTIAAKIKYLTTVRKMNPEEILVISFSNKSVNELNERIKDKMGIQINAMTFHKLGKDIIERDKEKRVDIAEDEFTSKNINLFFKQELLNKPETLSAFIQFYSLYLNAPKDENLYSTLGEYYDNTRNYEFETLKSKTELRELKEQSYKYIDSLKNDKITIKDEKVKSLEEVTIANFLFLNGITYEYESLYPYDEKRNYRKQYRPDFYLPEYDIWLEHFGINRDGSTPPGIDNKEYSESMKWKRELHKKNNTTLLETYSWQNRNGTLLRDLEQILKDNDVEFNPIDLEDLYTKLFLKSSAKRDRHFEQLKKLFITFLHLYKSSNKGISGFSELKTNTEREVLFVNVFKEIFKYYQSKLEEDKRIDFNDMINQATEIVESKKITFPYKYIIIDEYQDISFSRYNLIKAIKKKTDSSLMCVGDDWQSIYRFSGSDLDLFTHFGKYYGFTVITDIVKTYRNSQELIDLAGEFIMKNPEQMKKELISEKSKINPTQIFMYQDTYGNDENNRYSPEDYKAQAILSAIEHIIAQGGADGEILLLGRTNYDLEDISGYFKTPDENFSFSTFQNESKETIVKCSKYPNLKIRFLTVHRAKGLEAKNVIVLNMKNNLLGFPNQIADDPILSLVLANKDSYDFAEERRLFYVAITRTENRTYLITPERNYSIFIKDIIEEENVAIEKIGIEKEKEYGKCECGGNLVLRLGKRGPFLSCEHYPRHKYSRPCEEIPKKYICPVCGETLVRREGKNGPFIGCSGYPECTYTRPLDKNMRRRY